jgi:toxin ParE1/3/4
MSDPIVLKKPRSRIDLAVHYSFIGERSLDAARRFREAVEATLIAVAKSPGIGEPFAVANPQLHGLRCARVKRFRKHLIFYRPIPGGIEVIRVLHGARDTHAILDEADDE